MPTEELLASWNPPLVGDMDITIAADGRWIHQGRVIQRQRLVKLFAGILRREKDGEYYLVTPEEKWRVQVEDLPFVAVDVQSAAAQPAPILRFRTNLGEIVAADAEHPIETPLDDGRPRPRIGMGRGLAARINRNVFYWLVEMGRRVEGRGGQRLVVDSGAASFDLGALD